MPTLSPVDNIDDATRGRLQLPPEFYFGTAIGFFLASLMLNYSYGWLSGVYFIPVVAFALLGLVFGFIRRKIVTKTIFSFSGHKLTWRKRACVFAIWMICAWGPYLFMKGFYFTHAVNMPVPPGWKRASIQTTVLGWDNGAGYLITFEGEENVENALQFYRRFLENEGWHDCHRDVAESYQPGYSFQYHKNGIGIALGVVGLQYTPYNSPPRSPIYLRYEK